MQFTNLCSFPLAADVLSTAGHPSDSVLAIGLASGHVQIVKIPTGQVLRSGKGMIETCWQTRRHRSGCRALAYNSAGSLLVSAGADGIVKLALSTTGQVVSKIALPRHV